MQNHKPKLNVQNQVDYLENKGLLFNITNKKDAINFLSNSSYFYKLKSYSKNYEKKVDHKYINLEFAYLQELSTLDMHFRRFNIRLTLDLEHILKTKLVKDFNQNSSCDGYEIVGNFLSNNSRLKNELTSYNPTGYTAKDNILKKYGTDLALWNFIEMIDFGKFISFCNFYYTQYPDVLFNEIKDLLWSVKCLRNSSAHNNCLLHNLRPLPQPGFRRNIKVTQLLKDNIGVSKKAIEKKMQIPTIHDFLISLLVYKKISSSKNMGKHFNKDLHNLVNTRFRRKKQYFEKNTLLSSNYTFLRKVIIFLKKY